MGPQLDSCGRRRPSANDKFRKKASMGPQLDSCGRCKHCHHVWRPNLLQWGRNLTVAEGNDSLLAVRDALRLQWGRNLTVAEGATVPTAGPACAPLQWGRNLTVAEGTSGCVRPYRGGWASMGPQLDSCGRLGGTWGDLTPEELQWGRNLTVAEGGLLGRRRDSDLELQWGRNLTVAEGPRPHRANEANIRASMGPQLDSCGRRPVAPAAALSNAALQWGRNLTVAEGARAPPAAVQCRPCFNGAAT